MWLCVPLFSGHRESSRHPFSSASPARADALARMLSRTCSRTPACDLGRPVVPHVITLRPAYFSAASAMAGLAVGARHARPAWPQSRSRRRVGLGHFLRRPPRIFLCDVSTAWRLPVLSVKLLLRFLGSLCTRHPCAFAGHATASPVAVRTMSQYASGNLFLLAKSCGAFAVAGFRVPPLGLACMVSPRRGIRRGCPLGDNDKGTRIGFLVSYRRNCHLRLLGGRDQNRLVRDGLQISIANVHVDPQPGDCDFMHAPLGEKGCHYEFLVSAYNANGHMVGGNHAPKGATRSAKTGKPNPIMG